MYFGVAYPFVPMQKLAQNLPDVQNGVSWDKVPDLSRLQAWTNSWCRLDWAPIEQSLELKSINNASKYSSLLFPWGQQRFATEVCNPIDAQVSSSRGYGKPVFGYLCTCRSLLWRRELTAGFYTILIKLLAMHSISWLRGAVYSRLICTWDVFARALRYSKGT